MAVSFIKEGDILTATSVNVRFEFLRQAIDAVSDDGIEEFSLSHVHASESLVQPVSTIWPAGVPPTQVFAPTAPMVQKNQFPGHYIPPASAPYQDTLAAAEALTGAGGAWTVLRDAQPGGNPLRVWLKKSIALGMANADNIAAILVLASVEVPFVGWDGGGGQPSSMNKNESAYACIQFNDGGGTSATNWQTIRRTVRSLSSSVSVFDPDGNNTIADPDIPSAGTGTANYLWVYNYKSLDLATLIRPDDLADFTGNLRGVQVAVSGYDEVGLAANFRYEVQRSSLTVFLLHSKDPA